MADDFSDKVPLLLSFTQTKSTDALTHGLSNGTAIDSTTDKVAYIVSKHTTKQGAFFISDEAPDIETITSTDALAHIGSKQTTKQGADALSDNKVPIWIPFKGANAVAFEQSISFSGAE